MTVTAHASVEHTLKTRGVPLGLAAVLFVAGLAGQLHEAWGYALFLIATILVGGAAVLLGILLMTRWFDTDVLISAAATAFWIGAWSYLLAFAAFAGHFTYETVMGRMGWKWVVFGPAVVAAIVVLDVGLYRLLVGRNLPTWRRYGHVISRQAADPGAMRRTLFDEVLLHRTLFSTSRLRWLRHTLIFWGFGLMFAVELLAVVFREALPSFGGIDIWSQPGHPLRLAFNLAFETTGLAVLLGCLLALYWRWKVNGTSEQKYADTPTVVFLLAVVATGFVLEAMRIAGEPASVTHWASYVGLGFAVTFPWLARQPAVVMDSAWLVHVLLSVAFIAYVPIKRLVHSCATPMGRLMNSQKELLAAKKEASIRGLLQRKET